MSPHGAQFDVNLFTPSFLCINEKWTFATGSFAIFCPVAKLPSGRAVMKFVIAMKLTDKQGDPRLLVTVIKLLASVTRLLKKRWTLARLNLILNCQTR